MSGINPLMAAASGKSTKEDIATVEMNGEIFEYNPTLWKIIEVPEDFRINKDYPLSLQYIGPVVDGAIVEDFPWKRMPVSMYKTYANLKGLKKCPRNYMKATYRMFEGCSDMDEALEDHFINWNESSGSSKGAMFDGVISDKIIGWSRNTPINSIIDWLGLDKSLKVGDDFFSSTFKEVLGSLTPEMNINKSCFTTRGHKIECKVIHKSSELTKYDTYTLSPRVIVNALKSWTPIHYGDASYSICVLANDFVNDAGLEELFKVCGYNLTLEKYDRNINVNSSVVNVAVPNCTISAETPINTDVEELTIKSEIGSTLILKAGYQQPCIGPETATNLSYGRWSISYNKHLKTLRLDNVHVICESKVDNFSIGTYGEWDVPEIILVNGATLECPEMHGHRVLVTSGFEGVFGSTKSDTPAVYKLT